MRRTPAEAQADAAVCQQPEPRDGTIAATTIAWPLPETDLALGSRSDGTAVVHVWGWSLDALSNSVSLVKRQETDEYSSYDSLSMAELRRADQSKSSQHRSRFIAAHRGLREVLAGYLEADPAEINFEEGKLGKPRLAGGSTLRFNLSHSRDLAILAVSDGVELGVDVEFVRAVSEGIAERFFSPDEVASLDAVPQAERQAAFYTCWTRKEAFLKGVGTGVWGGLDTFTTSVTDPPALSDHGAGITSGWNLEHLDPAPGYVGAVAIKAKDWKIRCFSAAGCISSSRVLA